MIRRLLGAAAAVVVAVLPLAAANAANAANAASPTSPASPAEDSPSGLVTLASQTSWVDPVQNNLFRLRVGIATSLPPADTKVVINVYSRLITRSDFTRTLSNDYSGYVLAQPISATLDTLHPDADGVIETDIPIAANNRQGPNFLYLPTTGVYPVSVEIRPRGGGAPYGRLVTNILFNSAPPTGPKLQVAWVVPVHAPLPDPGSDGGVDAATRRNVRVLTQYLGIHSNVTATLSITPDTLAGLVIRDPALVALLGRAAGTREVLATTWVPMSLPAMFNAGMGDDVSLSLTRSTDLLTKELGTNVSGRTWVQDGPVDPDTLSSLRGAQFDRIVLPEADLAPSQSRFTVSQPFSVEGTGHTPIRAAVADAGLQQHFFNGGDQVLAAHQLLADLAQIYGDAPAKSRGVVVVTPRSWVPTVPFVDAWLAGLDGNPVLHATQLDDFFDSVPPAIGRGFQPAVRELAANTEAIRSLAVDLQPDQQRLDESKLRSLDDSLPPDSAAFARLDRLRLELPDEDLTFAERRDRVDALNGAIGGELGLISLGGPRTITLTARTGRLPLNLVSQSDDPVKVQLQIQSDKLQFPNVSSTGNATFQIELRKGNNPFDVVVRARTSGAFPLALTVYTHDGQLVMSSTKFTIQSTALSGVGVVLSAGAALFLIVWWARHAWRASRKGSHAKGGTGALVPAGQ